jgi:hypothetical protein
MSKSARWRIYANAQLTIISATTNSSDGLPGVGGTLRNPQPHLNMGSRIIASTLPHPQTSVGKSKWVTRGWTYQEGILSKRRLIFTDEQVLFECNSMHCAESLVLPLDYMQPKEKTASRRHTPDGPLGPKSPGTDPYEIMRYISEFARRDLTFQEDRVNAMKGIFHVFEAAALPVHQLMGVPILPPFYMNRSNSYKELSRTHEQGFLIGLTWSHRTPGTRITQFPTWSWAGWTGELDSELMFRSSWAKSPENTEVHIEIYNGEDSELEVDSLRFPTVENWGDFSLQEGFAYSRFIYLHAHTFPCWTVQFLQTEKAENGEPLPYAPPESGRQYVNTRSLIYLELNLDRPLKKHELSAKEFTGILIGDFDKIIEGVAIIVEQFDGYAERVAVSPFKRAKIQSPAGWATPGTGDFGYWANRRMEKCAIRLG